MLIFPISHRNSMVNLILLFNNPNTIVIKSTRISLIIIIEQNDKIILQTTKEARRALLTWLKDYCHSKSPMPYRPESAAYQSP